MSFKTANYLIVILAVATMILLVMLAALWLRPTFVPHVAEALPTPLATAVLPAPASIPDSPNADTPLLPTPTVTNTPVFQLAPPTVTAIPTSATISHVVQPGETLTAIALRYNVSVAAIVAASGLANAEVLIYPDQILFIPVDASGQQADNPSGNPAGNPGQTPTAAITTVPSTPTPWPPSLTGVDVRDNYPLARQIPSGGITIHYQPGTYPEREIGALTQSVDTIWLDIQDQLGRPVSNPVDLYLAGTLFSVNPALQGLAQSRFYRAFVLINGASHPGEERYIIAHELTHVAAIHLFGFTPSIMLHEGLAVHLPQAYLTDEAGYLPHTEICAALLGTPEFKTAVQMHALTYGREGFGGHVRTFFHYNLSGCFVTYLIETYGLESFDRLYNSGNYQGIYGRSLSDLDQEWRSWLTAVPVSVESQQLIDSVNNVALAFDTYFAASAGSVHANWEAYLHLNRARLAANRGQFDQAETELAFFYAMFAPDT